MFHRVVSKNVWGHHCFRKITVLLEKILYHDLCMRIFFAAYFLCIFVVPSRHWLMVLWKHIHLSVSQSVMMNLWWWIVFYCMVDRWKMFSLISNCNHCQRSSSSRISDTPLVEFKPAQNMSSSLVEWSCAVVITTNTVTKQNH